MATTAMTRIELLTKDNFDTWKIHMKALLIKNDAWGYVSGSKVKPEANEEDEVEVEEWTTGDSKAMSDIFLGISSSELKQVKNCATSRELWQKLEIVYQSKGPARKANLLKQIVLQRMSEGDDVRDHLRKFFDAVDRLSDMEVPINDDLLSILLLYSLPANFESFRIAIESRDELPSPETLRIKIVEESDARKNSGTAQVQNAMVADRSNQQKTGKSDKRNGKFPFKCYKCNKPGHKAASCRVKKGGQEKNKTGGISLYAAVESSVPSDASSLLVYSTQKRWCLDSGCTAHMATDIDSFDSVDENFSDSLNLANSSSTKISAKGVARLVTQVNEKDETVHLSDVLYVPDLRMNLLSVAKIVDKGYRVTFCKRSAEVVSEKDDRVVLCAERVDGLYFMNDSRAAEQPTTALASQHDEKSLMHWHKALGHLNVKDIREASKNNVLRGLDLSDSDATMDCEVCIKAKMTRQPFPKVSERKPAPGELIHSDVCGPMRVQSNGHARYFVTFIDDATRWCEVRFLRRKSEVFSEFRAFRKMVETQHEWKIKCLQSDNGTEYSNNQFDDYLKLSGIKRRLTVPNNPEQNGIAERRNRTLVEMARCLLIQSGLPPSFWAEAVCTANFTRNRCPTSALDGRTPFELVMGDIPDVSSFQEFGAPVYCLNRTKKTGKFEPRARRGVYLGPATDSKALRVWIPEEHRVEISRDVQFLRTTAQSNVDQYEEFFPEQVDLKPNNGQDVEGSTTSSDGYIDIALGQGRLTSKATQQPEQHQQQAEIPDEDDEPFLGFEPVDVPAPGPIGPTSTTKRGPGRPKKIYTGRPGRPRKHPVVKSNKVTGRNEVAERVDVEDASNAVEEDMSTEEDYATGEEDVALIAEVPLKSAVSGPEQHEWMLAMADEFSSILKNNTWTLENRPKNRTTVGSRIVLRNKYGADGAVTKRKARVVARGFTQCPGMDYGETYAPVARFSSIRLAMAFAAQHGMHVQQFDVSTAFLNGVIDEDIWMELPHYTSNVLRFIVENNYGSRDVANKAAKMLSQLSSGNQVCKMHKALYGLKQAGRCWYQCLNAELVKFGARPTSGDASIYVKDADNDPLMIVVYVDDILVLSRDTKRIREVYEFLSKSFQINDLGDVSYCLGIEFARDESTITMSQRGYVFDILDRFGMSNCRPVTTPLVPGAKLSKDDVWSEEDGEKPPYRELIGALFYLSVCTRPDIAHATSALSQFNDSFGTSHWQAAKRVLRYLKGTLDVGLSYSAKGGCLTGYVDADWAACIDDRRSYTGYAFTMSGGPISWESRKQRTVALSSTESEYMALTEASKEAMHLKRLSEEIGARPPKTIDIHIDNQGAKRLAENPVYHARTKHIDARHHFVREAISAGEINLEYLPTEKMPADVLTKGLTSPKHWNCLSYLGIEKQIV